MSEHAFEEKESLETAKSGVFNAVTELFREQPERVFEKEGYISSKNKSLQWAILTTSGGISYLVDLHIKSNEFGQPVERIVEFKVLTIEEFCRANNALYGSYMVSIPSGLFSNPIMSYTFLPSSTPIHETAEFIPITKKLTIRHLDKFQTMVCSSSLEHEEDAVRIFNKMRDTPLPETVDKLVKLVIGKEFPYRED